MRYSIVTPTVLRESLIRCCASVTSQSSKDWEHLVVVDSDLSSDVLAHILHPQRKILRCDKPHRNWGHSCRHNVYPQIKGQYCLYLDDDNWLADENVLRDLEFVSAPWALFPILRYGERFFHDPPTVNHVDTGNILVRREFAQWPDLGNYETDGIFIEQLAKTHPYLALSELRPLLMMPASSHGGARAATAEVTLNAQPRVSIFTPTNNNAFLQEAYASIKDQDFFEWCVVFNNGGIPTDFGDKRVKPHVLYKAPESVGALKAYACERATGDVLLELDHDDMLLPGAIAAVQEAFRDPEVGFAYSNCVHMMSDGTKQPRYDAAWGWQYRPVKFQDRELDEFVAFPPTPESVSRVWFGPDHFRAFRRSVYEQIGGHNRDLKVLDDSELVIRMYLATKFKHVDAPHYLFRVHGENTWLRFNGDIQKNVWPLYDCYIEAIVERWARLNKLRILELGEATKNGYEALRLRHFNGRWPIEDSSVGVLRSMDVFASVRDPIHAMKEAARVLAPGGWLVCSVPSTDGRGAWQDPRHCSYWNENSFLYYTNRNWAKYIRTPCRFQAVRVYTTQKDERQVCWVHAHLLNLKNDYRPAGLLEI